MERKVNSCTVFSNIKVLSNASGPHWATSSQVRSGRLGQVKLDQVRPGQVRSGQIKSGKCVQQQLHDPRFGWTIPRVQ